MKYTKPPLTFEEQADLLIERGMRGDRDVIISRLKAVNYYRLTTYCFPFRKVASEDFEDSLTIERVWDCYVFDRHLRLLIIDAVERVEIATRAHLAYAHAHVFGAFDYATNPASLPKLKPYDHGNLLASIRRQVEKFRENREYLVCHFDTKYGDYHGDLPIWMLAEVLTFGTTVRIFRASTKKVKQAVSSVFKMPDTVFSSWLLSLNEARNIAAHHGMLWNRQLGLRPMIPLEYDHPDWHKPVSVPVGRIYAILAICRHCVRHVAPLSTWDQRVRDLIKRFPSMPLGRMGFPSNWEESPIWSC